MSEKLGLYLTWLDWVGKGSVGLLVALGTVVAHDTYSLAQKHNTDISAIQANEASTTRELDSIQKKLDQISVLLIELIQRSK